MKQKEIFAFLQNNYSPFIHLSAPAMEEAQQAAQNVIDTLALLDNEAVHHSVIGDFPQVFRGFIGRKAKGGYIDKLLS